MFWNIQEHSTGHAERATWRNLFEEVEGVRGEMTEERLAEEADIALDAMDVEREWLREEEDRADAAMKKSSCGEAIFQQI